jgi:hypothetical protein
MELFCEQFEAACAQLQVRSRDLTCAAQSATSERVVQAGNTAEAERFLFDFRGSQHVFEGFRRILETSSNPYAHFQAACAVKAALVPKWQSITAEERHGLQHLCFGGLSRQPGLTAYVREQLLQILALLFKLSWGEQPTDSAARFNGVIQQLVDSGSREVAVRLMTAAVVEFGILKTSTIGVPWEFHNMCRSSFETTGVLISCLSRAIQFIGEMALAGVTQPPLVAPTLQLAIEILSWDFQAQSRMGGSFVKPENAPLTTTTAIVLPNTWEGLIAEPHMLAKFFGLYQHIRHDDVCSHLLRECLQWLAAVGPSVFSTESSRQQYYASLALHTLQLLQNRTPGQPEQSVASELADACQVLKRVAKCYAPALLVGEQATLILTPLVQLTIQCLREGLGLRDDHRADAFDALCEMWTLLIKCERLDKAALADVAGGVATAYVQYRLADSQRSIEEYDDAEEQHDDGSILHEQMLAIALLGRVAASQLLPFLQRELAPRINAMVAAGPSAHGGEVVVCIEQTYWLVMILGYILSDDGDGEMPMIPDDFLASQPTELTTLPAEVFRLTDLLTTCATITPQPDMCSPALAARLVWFLRRWARTYLFPDASLYRASSIPPQLLVAFDGDAGLALLRFMSHTCYVSIGAWTSEHDVLAETALLMQLLVSPSLSRHLRQCTEFASIVQLYFASEKATQLPMPVVETIGQSAVKWAMLGLDAALQGGVLAELLNPIASKLQSAVQRPDLKQMLADASVVRSLETLLHLTIGIVRGSDGKLAQSLVQAVFPVLECTAVVIGVCSTLSAIVQSVLRLFSTIASGIVPVLPDGDLTLTFYRQLHAMLVQLGAHSGSSDHALRGGADGEYEELQLTLKILTSAAWNGEELSQPQRSEVIFFGLSVLLPILEPNVLQLVGVYRAYFELISNIVETFPAKLHLLPPGLTNPNVFACHLPSCLFRYCCSIELMGDLVQICSLHCSSFENATVFLLVYYKKMRIRHGTCAFALELPNDILELRNESS